MRFIHSLPVAFVALGSFLPSVAMADVRVVVTSKPIHALVAKVMAGVGTPDVLVGGSVSPHAYAMKPSDARKVNAADVFFRVSEGFEPFTGKVVASLPKSVRVVSLADAPGLTLLERREGGAFEAHDHKHDHKAKGKADDHDDDGPNDPHVWLDPDNAKAMVRHIADVLAAAAPDKADALKANAEAEIASIDKLSAEIEQELKPLAGKPFVVYHDAYQYMEKRYGLTAVGSLTASPDVTPSGKRLQALRYKITSVGAVCIFSEPHFEERVTKTVADGTKTRTGLLDPEGTTLAAGPDLYATLMRNLARGFKDCLSGN